MQISIRKRTVVFLALLFAAALGLAGMLYHFSASNAEGITDVTMNNINYKTMELTLNTGGNAIVYYSTNKTKWYEAEGTGESVTELVYDISWLSATTTTTLYFRGNEKKTTLAVKIPGYNKNFKVTFDKTSGEFEFTNIDSAKVIRWRKTTDYNWRYVDADRSTKTGGTGAEMASPQSLEDFEKEVEGFRIKGTKLIFQAVSTDARPSKDVTVTIAAKKAAPTMKVNVKKMTVNTSTKLEWTQTNPFSTSASSSDDIWSSCTKSNMPLSTLAQDAVNGTKDVIIYFRTAATTSACESKIAALSIPKRTAAPVSPASIVCAKGKAAGKGKATLTFSNVPSSGYEYTIVKTGTLEDETKASWKTIKKAKSVKFSEKSLPEGATIYIRTAGVAANVNKSIELQLPSKYTTLTVGAYTEETSTTTDDTTKTKSK